MEYLVYEDHQTDNYDIFTLFEGERVQELSCCAIGIFRGQDQVQELVGSIVKTTTDKAEAQKIRARLNTCLFVHQC